MENYPKVLFLDTTLHHSDATGITLSNLFNFWPKEKLFMVGNTQTCQLARLCGFENVYIEKEEDFSHLFPLGLLIKLRRLFIRASGVGLIEVNNSISTENVSGNPVKHNYSKLRSVIRFLGLDHFFFRKRISSNFRKWIEFNHPEYIYVVLSTRHSILFAELLHKEFGIPIIIHIMDDWPSTIGEGSFFFKYWNKLINRELKKLIVVAHKRVAISKLMAQEYESRFGLKWDFFHNPVDLSMWDNVNSSLRENINKRPVKFGYFGRIGRANEFTLYAFIKALNELNVDSLKPLELCIYSNNRLPIEIANYSFITQCEFIEHTQIPSEMRLFDFLVLPLSFDENDFHFAKFSIPTKLSEYLISGIPCVAIVPEEFALSKFISENNCAFLINSIDIEKIKESLVQIIYDSNKLREISEIGVTVSKSHFSQSVVQNRFIQLFH